MKHPILVLTTLALALLTPAANACAAARPFSVRVTGHGRPMILIPGLACPGDVWDGTVAHFRDRFECHIVSLAGFGGTPPVAVDGPFLAAVRTGLADYARERRFDRPVVIGHSLGGFVALDFASTHPELAGPLVVIDGLPFFMGALQPGATAENARSAADRLAAGYANMDAEAYARMIRGGPNGSTMATKAEDIERIIAWGLASDAATVARAMAEMYATDLRPALAHIESPTLALAAWVGYAPYSSHDSIGRIYRAQYGTLPDVRIAITDTARHFIMWDEPAWTFAQIEKFLARLDASMPVRAK